MFSEKPKILALKNKLHELSDISSAAAVLSWDMETHMPPKGNENRAQQLATLAGIGHEKLVDPEVKKLIKNAKRAAETEWDKALVREVERAYVRATKVPAKLVKDMAVATSRAFETWRQAKEKSDFKIFAPDLEKVLKLKVQGARLVAQGKQSVYDVMLDEFEMGLTEEKVARIFEALKPQLIELAKKLAGQTKGADGVLRGKSFDEKKQWELGIRILGDMGYDLEAGRQDVSAHPFTITFGIQDVRITTWKDSADPRPALFATIHEGGHALYEQGVDLALDRLYLGETGGLSGGTGLAMHESQSRLWENMVGRSQEFWSKYDIPGGLGLDEWVKAVNLVRPSLVRVEADEVTYGLHIMLRFEIERELVAGKIKVKDLPKIWNQKYKEYLGITPTNDREGVLQDVHWAHGAFGYFPTYLLGSMMAAQLWRRFKIQEPRFNDQFDLKKLREWLREKIHRHGRVYSSEELLKKVTGETLNPKYYVEYLERKFEKLYP